MPRVGQDAVGLAKEELSCLNDRSGWYTLLFKVG